jgi:hypothetical protein
MVLSEDRSDYLQFMIPSRINDTIKLLENQISMVLFYA